MEKKSSAVCDTVLIIVKERRLEEKHIHIQTDTKDLLNLIITLAILKVKIASLRLM